MKNVKDQVYEKLKEKFPNISDQYPKDWDSLPAVQYVEEENRVHEHTDEGETKSYVRYRIDIWHTRPTSDAAMEVDEAMSSLGLVRTTCQDVPDPNGWKHKMMRYEGIIDMFSENVYWPN